MGRGARKSSCDLRGSKKKGETGWQGKGSVGLNHHTRLGLTKKKARAKRTETRVVSRGARFSKRVCEGGT